MKHITFVYEEGEPTGDVKLSISFPEDARVLERLKTMHSILEKAQKELAQEINNRHSST